LRVENPVGAIPQLWFLIIFIWNVTGLFIHFIFYNQIMEIIQNQHVELLEQITNLEAENNQLKQNQFEIARAKELYLKIFEDFPALIWRANLDKACDYFNRTWLEFTGRTLEQEIGYGWAEGVHSDDFDRCVDIYVTSFDKHVPFEMEYRLKNKYGEYRWIRDYGRPFYDLDNSFAGYIGSCYDITDSKLNELKLKELNDIKNRLFETIGHDLHNPFHGILGLSDLLITNINTLTKEKTKAISENIYNGSLTAYKLLENLLEWARLQSNNISFSPRKILLFEHIVETIEFVKYSADNKDIELFANIPTDICVYADPNMIKTIVRNLLANSIKYTHNGGKISISAIVKNKYAVILVEDNGVGMDDNTKNQLFKMDLHVSTIGTNEEKGTGLGLILCKEFAKKNHGEIWVESELNKGSQFYVSLPLNEI
jgi:PAS domain S-box-containing protein